MCWSNDGEIPEELEVHPESLTALEVDRRSGIHIVHEELEVGRGFTLRRSLGRSGSVVQGDVLKDWGSVGKAEEPDSGGVEDIRGVLGAIRIVVDRIDPRGREVHLELVDTLSYLVLSGRIPALNLLIEGAVGKRLIHNKPEIVVVDDHEVYDAAATADLLHQAENRLGIRLVGADVAVDILTGETIGSRRPIDTEKAGADIGVPRSEVRGTVGATIVQTRQPRTETGGGVRTGINITAALD